MPFWENKNVLVTGATGFVGSQLYSKLEKLGANVYGISKNNQKGKIYKMNILNLVKLDQFMKKKKIRICFHLAGESLVEAGQKDPYRTFKANAVGTLNILESSRRNKLERIIIASTSHVYGDNKTPYKEEYAFRPSRPYETSKACADLFAQAYATNFNLPVLIPRFVNIYGPGDLNFQRLIPKTIKSVLGGVSPEMWGGKATRDYLYIDDAIKAYVLLAKVDIKKVSSNRVFNFGSSNVISVSELMSKIIKISGKNLKIKKIKEGREAEITSQFVSFSKATSMLGWSPKIDLDEGLRRTVVWYQRFLYNKA